MYFEVLTNPLLQVNNVTKIAEIAHRYGAISIVDNTFVTPYLQLPLDQGADIVIHSATKYLAGHSEVNAGLVVVKGRRVGQTCLLRAESFGWRACAERMRFGASWYSDARPAHGPPAGERACDLQLSVAASAGKIRALSGIVGA